MAAFSGSERGLPTLSGHPADGFDDLKAVTGDGAMAQHVYSFPVYRRG